MDLPWCEQQGSLRLLAAAVGAGHCAAAAPSAVELLPSPLPRRRVLVHNDVPYTHALLAAAFAAHESRWEVLQRPAAAEPDAGREDWAAWAETLGVLDLQVHPPGPPVRYPSPCRCAGR
jgi:hypothetical protein